MLLASILLLRTLSSSRRPSWSPDSDEGPMICVLLLEARSLRENEPESQSDGGPAEVESQHDDGGVAPPMKSDSC